MFTRRAGTECAFECLAKFIVIECKKRETEDCDRESAKDEMIRAAETTEGRVAAMISEGRGEETIFFNPLISKEATSYRKCIMHARRFHFRQI